MPKKENNTATLYPVNPEEVEQAKLGWSNSSPGPDSISGAQVKRTDKDWLALIYSVILLSGIKPTRFRLTKTVLIHKSGDKTSPSSYKLISVSSTLQRLFHRILNHRLKEATLMNYNQRGFSSVDGTLANCVILDTFIAARRARHLPMAVASIDITKAFDTVSHYSVKRAMVSKGLEEGMITYIMNS